LEALVSIEDEKLAGDEQGPVVESGAGENGADDNGTENTVDQDVDAANEAAEDTSNEKKWQKEAEALATQIADLQDQAVRAKAETQNVRRRAEQDVEKAHKFALEKFAKELLPIIDGLEKAVEAEVASGNEMTTLREGIEMTLSMFVSSVTKFNLEQIDPIGKPFDPTLHEAMSMVDAPGAEPNTVIAAMQKGYTLNGRLVRPAMVMVAKGPAKVDEQA